MERFRLEGTFKHHLVQPPSNEQGHLQLDQVTQRPVQPDLECFQEFRASAIHYTRTLLPLSSFHVKKVWYLKPRTPCLRVSHGSI